MSFTRTFLLGHVFFRTGFSCSGGYHLERGGMPLQDVVGISSKQESITENQGVYGLRGVCLMMVCVLSDLS